MTKITKGWPPERRKKQAQNIRKTKPWKNSTGPATEDGKATCRHNSLQHGQRSAEAETLRKTLSAQRKILKILLAQTRL